MLTQRILAVVPIVSKELARLMRVGAETREQKSERGGLLVADG